MNVFQYWLRKRVCGENELNYHENNENKWQISLVLNWASFSWWKIQLLLSLSLDSEAKYDRISHVQCNEGYDLFYHSLFIHCSIETNNVQLVYGVCVGVCAIKTVYITVVLCNSLCWRTICSSDVFWQQSMTKSPIPEISQRSYLHLQSELCVRNHTTHRTPSVLAFSSYWRPRETIIHWNVLSPPVWGRCVSRFSWLS